MFGEEGVILPSPSLGYCRRASNHKHKPTCPSHLPSASTIPEPVRPRKQQRAPPFRRRWSTRLGPTARTFGRNMYFSSGVLPQTHSQAKFRYISAQREHSLPTMERGGFNDAGSAVNGRGLCILRSGRRICGILSPEVFSSRSKAPHILLGSLHETWYHSFTPDPPRRLGQSGRCVELIRTSDMPDWLYLPSDGVYPFLASLVFSTGFGHPRISFATPPSYAPSLFARLIRAYSFHGSSSSLSTPLVWMFMNT